MGGRAYLNNPHGGFGGGAGAYGGGVVGHGGDFSPLKCFHIRHANLQ